MSKQRQCGRLKETRMKIHTLAWDNTDQRMIDSHKMVSDHFGLDVVYTFETSRTANG